MRFIALHPVRARPLGSIRYICRVAPRNLVNLHSVAKGYGSRAVLQDVTLGINEGERVGVVGENGAGKSTLMRLLAGAERPDEGTTTHTGDLNAVMVSQRVDLTPGSTVRDELVGGRPDHEWARDAGIREVLEGLLGGAAGTRFPDGLETRTQRLSGGEQRRIMLARALLRAPELLLLDEPTNHLDVEGIAWLAAFLAGHRPTVAVITHDRWFLDAVCDRTWEVADGAVYQYEGGYSAYVLARAERDRQASAREDRRRQLVRKELAWLRRGPPARTSKPKFRIDAANALIADVPPARDTVELLRFATARLGDRVLDAVDVSVAFGARQLLSHVTWRLGPGQRVAVVGANGSGKTTLIRLLAGDRAPDSGEVQRGVTVKLAELSQDTTELPPGLRVVESLAEVRGGAVTSEGEELTPGTLAERFGFRGEKLSTRTEDLSGGERRRLQLMRVLLSGPNVLLLDEPTNDLDIDTLTALEDLLDGWPGTLIIVTHDRYFAERVCDDVFALMGDGALRHLPGGIDQYLELRAAADVAVATEPRAGRPAAGQRGALASPGAQRRATQKELARVERELDRAERRDAELQAEMAAAATDAPRLDALTRELADLAADRDRLEASWMELSETLEG
jgi:ATP-binding cassette subfamily F protein uup